MLAKIVAVVTVLLGLGALYFRFSEEGKRTAAFRRLGTEMSGEVTECKDRLGDFYAGWKKYRTEHKQADPPSIESLVPQYIKSPALLVCPTAKRLFAAGKNVDHGVFQGKHKMTYGFLWLAAGHSVDRKRNGENAALINCPVHKEVIARFAFNEEPMGFELPGGVQKQLEGMGATGQDIVVERDGDISYRAE